MTTRKTSRRDRFYWGQAGATYYSVDQWQGRIVGLLYWTEEVLGCEGGPGGDPVILEPGWLWVPADEPDYHRDVTAPPLTSGMIDPELAEAHDIALEAGGQAILQYLDSKGQLHVPPPRPRPRWLLDEHGARRLDLGRIDG
jgi:hypothetical protein